MDFRLFFSVIRRFKVIVAIGFLLACGLAFLTVAKVGKHGIAYRQQETFMATARVLVTSPRGAQDPTAMAQLYSQFATGDQVTRAAIAKHGVGGALQALAGYINRTSTSLPTISISAVASTPQRSATLANDAVTALEEFVQKQQASSGIAPERRNGLELLNQALPITAQVFTPRSKTPPVVVFILVFAATLGLAFVLENVRPRVRALPVEVEVPRTGAAGSGADVRAARQA